MGGHSHPPSLFSFHSSERSLLCPVFAKSRHTVPRYVKPPISLLSWFSLTTNKGVWNGPWLLLSFTETPTHPRQIYHRRSSRQEDCQRSPSPLGALYQNGRRIFNSSFPWGSARLQGGCRPQYFSHRRALVAQCDTQPCLEGYLWGVGVEGRAFNCSDWQVRPLLQALQDPLFRQRCGFEVSLQVFYVINLLLSLHPGLSPSSGTISPCPSPRPPTSMLLTTDLRTVRPLFSCL